MQVRPNAVRFGFVVLFGVFFALSLWLIAPGMFGLSESTPAGPPVTARVTRSAKCDRAGDGETVTFVKDGQEHQARFDGCGHREGEPVEVAVPATTGPDMVVHAAEAATGESSGGRSLIFMLFLLSTFAGGSYAYLYFSPRSPG